MVRIRLSCAPRPRIAPRIFPDSHPPPHHTSATEGPRSEISPPSPPTAPAGIMLDMLWIPATFIRAKTQTYGPTVYRLYTPFPFSKDI